MSVDRIGLAAHKQGRPVGDSVGGAREEAVLAMPKAKRPAKETPQQRQEREARETAERRAAALAVAARARDAGDCRELLEALELVESPPPTPAPKPPPRRPKPAIDQRLLAETYLTERAKGAMGVYKRIAVTLGLGEDAAKTVQGAVERLRGTGWLVPSMQERGARAGGSVAGPKLRQARAKDAPDGRETGVRELLLEPWGDVP